MTNKTKDSATKKAAPLADWNENDDGSKVQKQFTFGTSEKSQQFARRAVVLSYKLERTLNIETNGAKEVSISMPIDGPAPDKSARVVARKLRNFEASL